MGVPNIFYNIASQNKHGGYPLILGHPWLAIVDAYIECHSGNMTISQGESVKKLKLYPPTKSMLEIEEPLWIPPDDGSDYYAENVTPILTIEQALMLKEPSDERMISNFMQNIYSTTVGIRECDQHTEEEGASSVSNAEN
jgi:hypothetical protein